MQVIWLDLRACPDADALIDDFAHRLLEALSVHVAHRYNSLGCSVTCVFESVLVLSYSQASAFVRVKPPGTVKGVLRFRFSGVGVETATLHSTSILGLYAKDSVCRKCSSSTSLPLMWTVYPRKSQRTAGKECASVPLFTQPACSSANRSAVTASPETSAAATSFTRASCSIESYEPSALRTSSGRGALRPLLDLKEDGSYPTYTSKYIMRLYSNANIYGHKYYRCVCVYIYICIDIYVIHIYIYIFSRTHTHVIYRFQHTTSI